MQLHATATDTVQGEALVALVFSDKEQRLAGDPAALKAAAPWLAESPGLADFKAERGEAAVFYAPPSGAGGVAKVIAAGLGARADLEASTASGPLTGLDGVRDALATALRKARDLKVRGLLLDVRALPHSGLAAAGPERLVEEALVGALLGLYVYEDFKTQKSEPLPETLFVAGADQAVLDLAEAQAAGVALARDLVNHPANKATPQFMADTARDMARRLGLDCSVLERADILAEGMGAFESVFKGGGADPKLVVLEYRPEGKGGSVGRGPAAAEERPLVFVGKGVTFDSGGLSLKPPKSMEAMKSDMGGAAAVFGMMEAVGRLKPGRRVVALTPLTENMPDALATKPGDIVTAANGKTIEVNNTDAEGRLILADTLWYAARFEPELVIDAATLTGACLVALGNDVAAAFCADEDASRALAALGRERGELFWPMPLWELYFEPMKSPVADMKNAGLREGGCQSAALFLKQFAPKDVVWLHLDIAGPATTAKRLPTSVEGGRGFGVRTLFEVARRGGLTG